MKKQAVYFYVSALGFIPVWILLYFGYMFVAIFFTLMQLLCFIQYIHLKTKKK